MITLLDLITALKQSAPIGVEIPRVGSSNEPDEATIGRWAADAAQQINERRSKTTLKETTIELVAGEQTYPLPSDSRTVVEIRRRHGITGNALGVGSFGTLPSGQEVSRSLGLLQRLRLDRLQDEDQFEMIGGQIKFLFPIHAGETVLVRYEAIDRTYADLGDDRFTMVLDYLQWQNLDWWIGKHGSAGSLEGEEASVAFRRMHDLRQRWFAALNAIGPEAN